MKVDSNIIDQVSGAIKQILYDYNDEIEEATETNGGVAISIPVKLIEDGDNVNVRIGISFVKTKIRDEVNLVISPQQEMFEQVNI